MAKPPYDCRTCGACCRNTRARQRAGDSEYVQVFPTDILFRFKGLRAQYTVKNEDDEWHLRLLPNGSCAALEGEIGKSTTCVIHSVRPAMCRHIEPGDDKCVAMRRESGLPI